MHYLTHMDWPTRLAWGLLAWPLMIFLAIMLSYAADPRAESAAWVIAIAGTAEVFATAVAIVFPIWSLITWGQQGDPPEAPRP